jgi:hypothetical protein
MCDETPEPCDGCGKLSWILICDGPHRKYFCTECCEDVGHQPPFTDEEIKWLEANVW